MRCYQWNRKGAGEWAVGKKTNFLSTKFILEDSKHNHRNLVMAWVDYKKAFDMVPHSWIIESLKLAQVAPNVIDFVERSMRSWNAKLTPCGQTLGTVKLEEAYSRATAYHHCCWYYVQYHNKDLKKSQRRINTG